MAYGLPDVCGPCLSLVVGLSCVAEQPYANPKLSKIYREHDGDVTQVASAVIDLALKHRTKDDVTALVVRVWPASEWELRSPTANLDDGKAASFVS